MADIFAAVRDVAPLVDDGVDDAINDALQELLAMDPPVEAAPYHVDPPVCLFDEATNLLHPGVRDRFYVECISEETEIFTSPRGTTNTLGGFIGNIKFDEETLIKTLDPTPRVAALMCNYGCKQHEMYAEPEKKKLSNRGRKKKQVIKKPRKKQGSGEHFNSQITFVIYASDPTGMTLQERRDLRRYKFKVFRTGPMQIPGAKQLNIEAIIDCAHVIADMLSNHLGNPPEKRARVLNINPVMKNYKFTAKLRPEQFVDLDALQEILLEMKAAQQPGDRPWIFIITYSRQDTKLAIKFLTPIPGKPKKKTRVNIFMSGKVNILGACDTEMTKEIFAMLNSLFIQRFDEIVVIDGSMEVVRPYVDNVEPSNEVFKNRDLGIELSQEEEHLLLGV